ncbi:putative bifunctional diguanylate cyclase/phosphodiesterase [Roseibium aggregatum]|uniref:GGDEF domain-containing protein n=1 Tax=Roseibium aggregatum TaxID=187304 RepID=A0A939ECF2_9HYPH|nr:bifunctional diguanylate cyclase/phosphodiesterase [Roseibium aggregatum]MBN9670610.1 GGDEF domain-containing protein [Roseibium aggregatum]
MSFDRLLLFLFPALCGVFAVFLALNTYGLIETRSDFEENHRLEWFSFREAIRLNTSDFEDFFSRYTTRSGHGEGQLPKLGGKSVQATLENLPSREFSTVLDRSNLFQNWVAAPVAAMNGNTAAFYALDALLPVDRAVVLPETVAAALQNIAEMTTREADTRAETARRSFQIRQGMQTGLALATIASALGWVVLLLSRNSALRKECQDRMEDTDRLLHIQSHDPLTGLFNQKEFSARLRRTYQQLSEGQVLNVVSINLDAKSPKTAEYCQSIENAILVSAADILRHAAGVAVGAVCLARANGKGFLAYFTTSETEDPAAHDLVMRIRRGFQHPVATDRGAFLLPPAIGIANTETVDKDPAELIRNADLAAYEALANPLARPVTYQPSMRAALDRTISIEQALPDAIENGEFLPYYQPQFNLMSGRIVGVEALARWNHADLGWISPSEFIPLAENSGDIVPIGWQILERACREILKLPGDLTLSLNLSVSQLLDEDVVFMLEDCLERTGLPASRLKIEVTETTVMSDRAQIQTTLSSVRSLGIALVLDDFGMGFSELSCLTDFHWDLIKIDGAFATRATSDDKIRDILKLVLGIAAKMGSEVLVEGIETVDQCDVLADLGCANGQGYLFGGPMAIDDIKTLFFQGHRHPDLKEA